MNDAMKQNEEFMEVILTVLSAGTVIGPILFGFAMFRMASIFVTKTQFDDYKLLQHAEQQYIMKSLDRIEKLVESK